MAGGSAFVALGKEAPFYSGEACMFWMFIGFLLGVVETVGVVALLLWWMNRGANTPSAVKLLERMAAALSATPKSGVPGDVPTRR